MPNHCYQSVFIKGPRDLVRELYTQLTEHNRFCDAVSPMPLEMWAADDVVDTKYGLSPIGAWYLFRNENWNTKWDVCDVEIDDSGLEHSDEEYPIPVAWFSFKCWTAWAPPVPVWDKLHAMGIEVQADYQDEGMNFAGEYAHGEDKCWKPEEEEA